MQSRSARTATVTARRGFRAAASEGGRGSRSMGIGRECEPRTVVVGSDARGGANEFDDFLGVAPVAAGAGAFCGDADVALAFSVGGTTLRETEDTACRCEKKT